MRKLHRFGLVHHHDVISDFHDNRVSNCIGCSKLVSNVRFNLLKKPCDKIHGFYSAVIEIKLLIETNCTLIIAAHVIVEIITG